MLDTIVRYLHESLTPFRLASYPSPEQIPRAAHPIGHHAILVDTQIVIVENKLVLVCFPADELLDIPALSNALSAPVVDALEDDLPSALQGKNGPPPPFGQLFGMPVVIDEGATTRASIVFQPFGESDYFEIPYDDFARLETPRVASFARAGELPSHDAAEAAPKGA
jgi:Ala-tRNA(Pro) deacylase